MIPEVKVVAGATESTVEEMKENKEVKAMNNVEEFIKEQGEKLAQNKEVIVMNSNKTDVVTATNSKEERIEKLRTFGRKNRTDLNNYIAFNDKVEMSERERRFWEQRIKPLVKAFDESITYLVETIPAQEEGMAEIKQLLADKPITNIKVEFAEGGKFSVMQTTGEILMTGNKEEVKGCLNGLYIAQQATAQKTE